MISLPAATVENPAVLVITSKVLAAEGLQEQLWGGKAGVTLPQAQLVPTEPQQTQLSPSDY